MAAPLGGRLCAGTIMAVSLKPADSDLGMSGEGSTAAVGYVQFYAWIVGLQGHLANVSKLGGV